MIRNSILTGRGGQKENECCSAKYRENVDDLFGQATKQASANGDASAGKSQSEEEFVCFVVMLLALTGGYTQTACPQTFPVWFPF